MNTRRLVAGFLVAGSLTAGVGVMHADAATVAPTLSTRRCAALAREDHQLVVVQSRLVARIAEVTAARDAAATAGRTHAVRELNRRLAELNRTLTRATAAIAAIEARIASSCAPVVPTPAVTPNTTPTPV